MRTISPPFAPMAVTFDPASNGKVTTEISQSSISLRMRWPALREEGLNMVVKSLTTLEEVLRVTAPDE